MGNQKIVNYLKKKYIKRKNLFLLTSFYSLIFPFSCLTFASDTANNYEEKINNPLINQFKHKNYLFEGKTIPNLVPITSGEIKTNSQLFNTKGYVKIKGPKINLTVKDADAKDLLLSLANVGNYGLVFVPSSEE